MVPKHGAINGIQYLIIKISGACFFICLPTLIQLSGFTEFTVRSIFKFAGAGEVEYCVLPGNKILGYCKVNVIAFTS